MTVDTYTYGTVAGVHRRIGWIVASRAPFDGTTQPALSEVEAALDGIASNIHAKLIEAGYPVNTKASVTTTSARLAKWLENINEDGAAADLLMTFPSATDPDSANNPPKYFSKRYEAGLSMIAGKTLDRFGLSREETLSEGLESGSYKTSDGDVKKPLFSRSMMDYPSSRSLTE